MSNPTLEAVLKLNANEFAAQIDKAKAKANSFDNQMGQMKSGLRGVSSAMSGLHSITGMTSGALGGIARVVSGFVMSFRADPVFAVVAAISALAAAVGSYVDNQATKMLEITKKQIEAYKAQRAIWREASGRYGMTPWARAGSQVAEAIGSKDFASAAAVRGKIKEDIAVAEAEIAAMKFKPFDEKDPLGKNQESRRQDLFRQLEIHKRKLKEVDEEYARLAKSSRSSVEKEIENDQIREQDRAKLREDGRKSVSDEIDKDWKEFEQAEKKKADLREKYERERRDILAGKGIQLDNPMADSMARMGGYIGSQADPNARERQKREQQTELMIRLVQEIREEIAQ